MLNEELLFTWLQLGTVIDNQRLVSGLPFNEALVCGLLVRAQERGIHLTASDLCLETRILKSQMNAILRSLEKKGYILRQQSIHDRRQINLELLPEGYEQYQISHQRSLAIVDSLIDAVGEDRIRQLIPMLQQVTTTFDSLFQEV